MMKFLFLLTAGVVAAVTATKLPPSCSRPVYCHSDLLHYVQMSRIFQDSKTFVDLEMRKDEQTTLNDFQELLNRTSNNPPRKDIEKFVAEYFTEANELHEWTPSDYKTDPLFLNLIRDEQLRKYGKDINAIWPTLGRKVKDNVIQNPDQFSLIPVTHGFIIPGGRFKELYYWDTYWIIEGLLISGMQDTARGMIENFFDLIKKIGHIPNGSRWYYQQRSQPPLLTAMVNLYVEKTKDIDFLKQYIDLIEDELEYWLETQVITFEKDDKSYTLLRYYAPSKGPRPESYYEDYMNAQVFDTTERQNEFYIDIKSAAESGWDFSTRWFIDKNGTNDGNLTSIHCTEVVPVDLNAIFANALQDMANFLILLQTPRKATQWAYLAKQWRINIEEVLWDKEDGVWYDYDLIHKHHRKYFYPSNVAPLWMNAVEPNLLKEHAPKVIKYLRHSQGLDFPGGVPTSLIKSGEQWDFPNAWPPLISIIVNSLEATGLEEGNELAFHVAQIWIRSCYKGFSENKQMFEKYDVNVPGKIGGGGEYTVQTGFGWSNGVVLEFLVKYGQRLTAAEQLEQRAGVRSKINTHDTSIKNSQNKSSNVNKSLESESSESSKESAPSAT